MKKDVIFAGGCFWCVEHDLREVDGVVDAMPGYAGHGNGEPSYENHEGFREAVKVIYDTEKTNFKKLCQFFLDHIDPTDAGGQFYDRGHSYQTAIYYKDDNERKTAINLINELDASELYKESIKVQILEEPSFYEAEEYHQNYAEKYKIPYDAYKSGSGREEFQKKVCLLRAGKKINWKD